MEILTRHSLRRALPCLLGVLVFAPLAATAAEQSGVVHVTTRPVGELLIHPEHSAPAVVEAQNDPQIAAEISTRIEAIPARIGDQVAAGDLLVKLDCRSYRSQLAAARAAQRGLEAQRKFAASQLERARDLRRQKNLSAETLEQREAELASFEAQLAGQRESVVQAALQVEDCEIVAPFSAVVAEHLSDVGAMVTPGSPVLKLVQLDQLEVAAELREREALRLEQGAQIEFEYIGRRYPVTLRRLPAVVDERQRTREARLVFDGESAPPGAAGRLLWRERRPALPAEYLVRRNGSLGVFLDAGGRARFIPLPDALEGQPAGVDLPADTWVVVEGRQRLNDGDRLTIDPPQQD